MLRLKFGRKDESLQQAFAEFSKSLTLIVDLEQLKDNVIARIRETIHTGPVAIFLLDPDLNRFELAEVRGAMPPSPGTVAFHPNEPLMQWFAVNETYLDTSRQEAVVSFFAQHERELLEAFDTKLVFPLLVMNHVTGLVCLGPKEYGHDYTSDEIDMLNTLLGQAAFAFENAYLYQQQKNRLRKMYRADRLATLGQLAAGAAHEIRNPLTSIRSTIQYLRKDIGEGPKHELMTELIEEVDRINTIIEGLLSFSKPGTPQVEEVDLEQIIDQTISLIATTADKNHIVIHREYETEQCLIAADPAQLKQVFLNIVMNAIQAMSDGGNITITVDERAADSTVPDDQAFVIRIVDTGAGIPQDNLDHIFDPFFTTKKDGTGLGLSITYGIIRQHGGDIEIVSTADDGESASHGTTVTITLPAKNRQLETGKAHDSEHTDR